MSVEEQEQELIALVEANRDRTCDELMSEAKNKRQELIHAAYREARERLHQAVERERARANLRIRSAVAELHTRKRAVEQRDVQSLLQESWKLLTDGLKQRWDDAEGQRAWIERCIEAAIETLPGGEWIVMHPADCDKTSLDYLQDSIAAKTTNNSIQLQPDSDMSAGLVITSDRQTRHDQ